MFSDGTMDIVRDGWKSVDDARRVLPMAWTGETWFFLTGHEPGTPPPRRAYRVKQRPRVDVPEPDVLARLRTGAGIDREGLGGALTALWIERNKLGAAQRVCPDLAVIYVIHAAELAGKGPRDAVLALQRSDPDLLGGRNVDNCLRAAESFELIQGVLFRRCYDAVPDEVQLRCAVPNVTYGMFELPSRGRKTIGYRERLLLEYHNGPLARHLDRERTYERLSHVRGRSSLM
jgi:hypothetical protein